MNFAFGRSGVVVCASSGILDIAQRSRGELGFVKVARHEGVVGNTILCYVVRAVTIILGVRLHERSCDSGAFVVWQRGFHDVR